MNVDAKQVLKKKHRSTSAYLWTFEYERGFGSYFGLPPQFINIALVNVLVLAALIIGFLEFAITMSNSLITLFFPSISRHPVVMRHATTLTIILPIFMFLLFYTTRATGG